MLLQDGRAFFIVILIRFLPTLGGVLGNLEL